MAKPDGKLFKFESVDKIRTDFLEGFEFNSPTQLTETVTHEFSAVCPFSGLPDVATLKIRYYPVGGKCIELKSLKYYITSFRNVGLYQEGCTERIYNDLSDLLGLPNGKLEVKTTYNVRGGFVTICTEGHLVAP